MGFQTDTLTGLATLLAGSGVAAFKPNGVYAAGEIGIVFDVVPDRPDRVVTLTAYPVTDHPTLSDSVLAVQVRCRWAGADPRPVGDLTDAVFDQLHGLRNVTLSTGVRVVQCHRQSGGSLGQDGSGRHATTSNYYLDLWRPSPHRT